MSVLYRTRPLSDTAWLRPNHKREFSRFRATHTDTLDLLGQEIEHLRGRDVVIGVDVTEADLRLDGTLRARARSASPAVEVAFASVHGPMLYRCDQYLAPPGNRQDDWQHNLRAIALTLQALRAVDRYGASNSGEQYRGYRQIDADPAHLPNDSVWDRIRQIAGHPLDGTGVPLERGAVLISRAMRAAHPDTGGSHELWQELQSLTQQVSI